MASLPRCLGTEIACLMAGAGETRMNRLHVEANFIYSFNHLGVSLHFLHDSLGGGCDLT